MKRIIRYVSIVLLCSFLCGTVVEAHGTELYSQQSNNSRRNNKGSKDKKDNDRKAPERRPGNSGNNRPGNAPASRPQQRPSNNNSNKKPQQNNGKHNRPGGNVITRPSRPAGNHHNPPVHNKKPGGPNKHGYRPPMPPQAAHHGNKHHHYYRPTPPPRPYLPPARPYHRPLPPPAWHAPAHWNPFRTILGVALGSTISASINMLVNAGYTINSYVNNAIYLNNVPMLNVYWPDATMYYNNGSLAGSEFVYYTPSPDRYRFDSVYNTLVRNYGAPASQSFSGSSLSASWWGAGNQFITLTYSGQYSVNGGLNYYTTLTFGH